MEVSFLVIIFCVILDNKDNKGKETVTIVPLSSKGNKNYLKLNESVLNLTTTDLKKQIIDISSKVQALAQNIEILTLNLAQKIKSFCLT